MQLYSSCKDTNFPQKGSNPMASGVGGGTECAACTVLVAMAEQLAYIHDKVNFYFQILKHICILISD